jgi:heavy metal efflux system protein
VKVFGDDFDQLVTLGAELESAIAGVEGAADVAVEQATGLPVLTIVPKRDAMARFGLSMNELQETVSSALSGSVASLFYEGDRRSNIVVRLPEDVRSDPDKFASLPVPLPDGERLQPDIPRER